MNKLLFFLVLFLLPLTGVSQNGPRPEGAGPLTPKLAVTPRGDTTFLFTPDQARIIAKKLVSGESARLQLNLLHNQVGILSRQNTLKDSTIRLRSAQMHLLKGQVLDGHTLATRQNIMLMAQQDQVRKLKKDLRRQRLKTRLAGGLGITAVILALLVH